MARGPKKHLKRVAAPRHWMLSKMGGVYAPRPATGPHKRRECLPLVVLLRNRLGYALTYREAMMILHEKGGQVKVDGKIRKNVKYPAGFMDVISIERTGENFRLLYDVKGRFSIHRIDPEEASFKLCRVKKRLMGPNNIPYIVTHDGRTIRYPHPEIHANDTVKIDIETGVIQDFIKMEPGNLAMVTGGKNAGRVGTVSHTEKHDGGFDIIHIRDRKGHAFATRVAYATIIGKGKETWVSLPKHEGVKPSILEEQAECYKQRGYQI